MVDYLYMVFLEYLGQKKILSHPLVADFLETETADSANVITRF